MEISDVFWNAIEEFWPSEYKAAVLARFDSVARPSVQSGEFAFDAESVIGIWLDFVFPGYVRYKVINNFPRVHDNISLSSSFE